MKWIENILNCWKKKKYGAAFGYAALIIAISAIVILATAMFINVVFMHLDAILMIIGGYIFLFFFFQDWKKGCKEKQAKEEERQIVLKQQRQAEVEGQERTLYEANYIIVRRCLFAALADIADTVGLVKPSNYSELDSPARIIPQSGIVLFQYLVLKKDNTVNLSAIKEILQTRIVQKLENGEFHGIAQSVLIWQGRAFPILYIDSAEDSGTYVQVNITLMSDKYCELMDLRLRDKVNSGVANRVVKDSDF